ncbi:MAG: hypothetical protein V2J26_00970 [Pacificimonas sp.]|jgi:hypothetical protein|nr:hypothetical protein [Pacificimonas sp.]
MIGDWLNRNRVIGAVGAAAIGKAAVGFVFSTIIVSQLEATVAAAFFQILFLQAMFVTFVSASGFVRGVQAHEVDGNSSGHIRLFLRFSTVTALAAFALSEFALPDTYLGTDSAEQRLVIALLLVGGVATGANAIIQGSIVRRYDRAQVFLVPLAASGIALILLGLFWQRASPVMLAAVWLSFQVLTPVTLLAAFPAARELLAAAFRTKGASAVEMATIRTGFANVFNSGAVFAFREVWRLAVPAEMAALTFFIVRIFEMIAQMAYQLASSAPSFIDRFNRSVLRAVEERRAAVTTAFLLLSILGLIGMATLEPLGMQVADAAILITAELLILPAKTAAAIALVSLLFHTDQDRYFITLGATAVAVLILAFSVDFANSLLALQIMNLTTIVIILAMFVFLGRPTARLEE